MAPAKSPASSPSAGSRSHELRRGGGQATLVKRTGDELAERGRLVQPIGPGGDDVIWRFRKEDGEFVRDARLLRAFFVPLVAG